MNYAIFTMRDKRIKVGLSSEVTLSKKQVPNKRKNKVKEWWE